MKRVLCCLEHGRRRFVFFAVELDNVIVSLLVRVRRGVLAARTVTAIHSEDVQVCEAKKSGQRQRPNAG